MRRSRHSKRRRLKRGYRTDKLSMVLIHSKNRELDSPAIYMERDFHRFATLIAKEDCSIPIGQILEFWNNYLISIGL